MRLELMIKFGWLWRWFSRLCISIFHGQKIWLTRVCIHSSSTVGANTIYLVLGHHHLVYLMLYGISIIWRLCLLLTCRLWLLWIVLKHIQYVLKALSVRLLIVFVPYLTRSCWFASIGHCFISWSWDIFLLISQIISRTLDVVLKTASQW